MLPDNTQNKFFKLALEIAFDFQRNLPLQV